MPKRRTDDLTAWEIAAIEKAVEAYQPLDIATKRVLIRKLSTAEKIRITHRAGT
jgi:hypothetical protein